MLGRCGLQFVCFMAYMHFKRELLVFIVNAFHCFVLMCTQCMICILNIIDYTLRYIGDFIITLR